MESSHTFTLLLSEKAGKEIETSWLWYEEREQKLGDRFVEEVVKKLNKIVANPLAYQLRYKQYRQASISVFPFVIIFSISKRRRLNKSAFCLPYRTPSS